MAAFKKFIILNINKAFDCTMILNVLMVSVFETYIWIYLFLQLLLSCLILLTIDSSFFPACFRYIGHFEYQMKFSRNQIVIWTDEKKGKTKKPSNLLFICDHGFVNL